jgi:hypothetical protein
MFALSERVSWQELQGSVNDGSLDLVRSNLHWVAQSHGGTLPDNDPEIDDAKDSVHQADHCILQCRDGLRDGDLRKLLKTVDRAARLPLGAGLWEHPCLAQAREQIETWRRFKPFLSRLSSASQDGVAAQCACWADIVDRCQLNPQYERHTLARFAGLPQARDCLEDALERGEIRILFEVPWADRAPLLIGARSKLAEIAAQVLGKWPLAAKLVDGLDMYVTRGCEAIGRPSALVMLGPAADLTEVRDVLGRVEGGLKVAKMPGEAESLEQRADRIAAVLAGLEAARIEGLGGCREAGVLPAVAGVAFNYAIFPPIFSHLGKPPSSAKQENRGDPELSGPEKRRALVMALADAVRARDEKVLAKAIGRASFNSINQAAIEASVFEQKRLIAFGVLRKAVQMRDEPQLQQVLPECEAAGVERAAVKMAAAELERLYYTRHVREVVFAEDEVYIPVVQKAKAVGVDPDLLEKVAKERRRHLAEVELARAIEAGNLEALQKAIDAAKECGVSLEDISRGEDYLRKLVPLFDVFRDEFTSEECLAAAVEAAKKAGVSQAALAEAVLARRRVLLLGRLAVAVIGQHERNLEEALEEASELKVEDDLVDDAKSRLKQLVALRYLNEAAYGDDTDVAHAAFSEAFAQAAAVGVHEIRLAEVEKERKRHLAELDLNKALRTADGIWETCRRDFKRIAVDRMKEGVDVSLPRPLMSLDIIWIQTALSVAEGAGVYPSTIDKARQELELLVVRRGVQEAIFGDSVESFVKALETAKIAGMDSSEAEQLMHHHKALHPTEWQLAEAWLHLQEAGP